MTIYKIQVGKREPVRVTFEDEVIDGAIPIKGYMLTHYHGLLVTAGIEMMDNLTEDELCWEEYDTWKEYIVENVDWLLEEDLKSELIEGNRVGSEILWLGLKIKWIE